MNRKKIVKKVSTNAVGPNDQKYIIFFYVWLENYQALLWYIFQGGNF